MHTRFCLIGLVALFISACVTVDPAEEHSEKASAINVQLGIGYLEQDNMVQASDKLSKALRQDPKSASAHNAYAMLQDRLLQKEKAEEHYKIALELDPKNSQANNNYGTFLCLNNREAESESYFLQAVKDPLYKTPEFAYTNAARCMISIKETDQAKIYLRKALAANSRFGPALLASAELFFDDQNFKSAKVLMEHYHRVRRPTAQSLWLAIRIELDLGENAIAEDLADMLYTNFPQSNEYQNWLSLQ
jgi:type IV pilus assembly protein PilF